MRAMFVGGALFGLMWSGLLVGCTTDEEEPDPEPLTYGNFAPDHIVAVDLTMAESDWDAMRNESRSFFSEFLGDCRAQPFSGDYTTFSADLTMDGESLSNIGIRKKGFIGSQSTEKPSLKLNLDEYVAGAELFGTDNITLNNAVQDPSLIRQCLSYDLLRKAGLAAPRCNFARVSMNGDDLGIYVHVEPIKRAFLRDHFGSDDGDLYEGTLSDFRADWMDTFDPKNSDTDANLGPIQGVVDALESSGSVTDNVDGPIDLDQFLTFWAMETLVAHWDGYAGNTNNFYIYRDPSTGSFQFIPWGMDAGFQLESLYYTPFSEGVIAHDLLESAEGRSLFEERVLSLLDSVWSVDALLAEIDRMVALLETEIDLSERADAISDVRDFVEARAGALQSLLPGEAGELQDTFCIVEVGSIEAEFATTWNSLEEENLTQVGELDWTMTWEGSAIPFSDAGVGAGWSEEEAPLLVFVGAIEGTGGAVVIPYVYFDYDLAGPDVSLSFESGAAGGAVLYTEPAWGGEMVSAGFLEGGTLHFDEFSGVTDGVVSGSLSTPIYAWE